ncbi:Uncharacterised protein [Mycobacterium tuberculosis]|uniref:Uncharacterized protein n=1 Tax=Mycobacterium tuberculosis TaxID=1773 RepID=A0A655AHK1_MYCTX|nr:Uncharacterised protein [Mycobacterium tuberculosis]CNV40986.1 Uncharacterised protein [Mycobacterium tuberculosis]CNV78585.1 Uncharacterised protein [Mycobacterium tuberculosis]
MSTPPAGPASAPPYERVPRPRGCSPQEPTPRRRARPRSTACARSCRGETASCPQCCQSRPEILASGHRRPTNRPLPAVLPSPMANSSAIPHTSGNRSGQDTDPSTGSGTGASASAVHNCDIRLALAPRPRRHGAPWPSPEGDPRCRPPLRRTHLPRRSPAATRCGRRSPRVRPARPATATRCRASDDRCEVQGSAHCWQAFSETAASP